MGTENLKDISARFSSNSKQ